MDLKCFSANKNLISAWCYSHPPHSPWIVSCVYGPPTRSDKLAFWDWFTSVGTNFDAPWLCIGDFNSMLSQLEKLAGRPVNNSSTKNFRNFVDQLGTIDLGFAGNPFTRCNNSHSFSSIKERLDRGLASQRWIPFHPDFALLYSPAFNSDHNPISLNTNNHSSYLRRPFRFEEF